jgi:RHS repeat-associated protein
MPGRRAGTTGRHLYNGKEQDPEIKGTGNQYDYGFRIQDPRLGRFLSVDPLHREYAMFSPYQYAGNRPIVSIDLEGLEPQEHPYNLKPIGKTYISQTKEGKVYEAYQVSSTSYGNGKQWVAKIIEEIPDNSGFTQKPIEHFMYFNNEAQRWQPWQRGDEPSIRYRQINQVANGIGVGFFGVVAVGAALPAMSATGGAGLLQTNFTAKAGLFKALAGGVGDILSQKTVNPDQSINFYSVGASALFSNVWTSAAFASATQRNSLTGEIERTPFNTFVSTFAINGTFGALSTRVFGNYSPRKFTTLNDNIVRTLGATISSYWSGTAAGVASAQAVSPQNEVNTANEEENN